jgi:uncharacterized alpha-E superfamily protein
MLAAGGAFEPEALESLLEILDSVMTYRSRYATRYQLAAVLDLIICDETNPRSIAFQLMQCSSHFKSLEIDALGRNTPSGSGPIAALLKRIRDTDIVRISKDFEINNSVSLFELFDALDTTLPVLSDAVSHRYFFHSGTIGRLADF